MNLRNANIDDLELLFKWANDPAVRQNSFDSNPIKMEEHKNWYESKLKDKNVRIYILEDDNQPLGQIRFTLEKNRWYIGYIVAPEARGNQLGSYLIRLGIAQLQSDLKEKIFEIVGEVKSTNPASIKTFLKCGFSQALISNNVYEYRINPNLPNYLIVSSNRSNRNLNLKLKESYPNFNFHLIKHNKCFSLEMMKAIKPVKVFLPHWILKIPKEIHETYQCILFHMSDSENPRGFSPLQSLTKSGKQKANIAAIQYSEDFSSSPTYSNEALDLKSTSEEIFDQANRIINAMISYIIEEKTDHVD